MLVMLKLMAKLSNSLVSLEFDFCISFLPVFLDREPQYMTDQQCINQFSLPSGGHCGIGKPERSVWSA